MPKVWLTLFPLLLAVAFTGYESTRRPALYLSHFDLKQPSVGDFDLCQSAGCRKVSALGYSESEWSDIRSIFGPAPRTPEAERKRIKIAVAAIEQINGAKYGTSGEAQKKIGI